MARCCCSWICQFPTWGTPPTWDWASRLPPAPWQDRGVFSLRMSESRGGVGMPRTSGNSPCVETWSTWPWGSSSGRPARRPRPEAAAGRITGMAEQDFSRTYGVKWADLDPNGHVRPSVYYDYAV